MFVTCFWLLPTEVCSPLPDPSGPHGCREGRMHVEHSVNQLSLATNLKHQLPTCKFACSNSSKWKEPRSKHHFISYLTQNFRQWNAFAGTVARAGVPSSGYCMRTFCWGFGQTATVNVLGVDFEYIPRFQVLYNIDLCDDVPHGILSRMPDIDSLFHAIRRPKEYVHVYFPVFWKRCYLFPTAGIEYNWTYYRPLPFACWGLTRF